MAVLKAVADALTWLRLALGPVLAMVGVWGGADALPVAARLILVGWASDGLDGPLARKAAQPQSWIGRNDLLVDVCFSLGVWLYLSFAGWVHPLLATSHVVLGGLALWRAPTEQLAWGVQGLPYVLMGLLALKRLPLFGWLMVTYAVGVTVITWPRIPRRAMVLVRAVPDLFRRNDAQGAPDKTAKASSPDAD